MAFKHLGILLLLCLAVGAGFLFQQQIGQQQANTAGAKVVPDQIRASKPVSGISVGDALPAFTLNDIDGKARNNSEWDGKVLVINFWATWCPPCVHEIPMLIQTQKDQSDAGLQIIGVALDKPADVKAFADDFKINYPTLVGSKDAIALTQKLGNQYTTLPYTIFVDRKGIARVLHSGDLNRAEFDGFLKDLL